MNSSLPMAGSKELINVDNKLIPKLLGGKISNSSTLVDLLCCNCRLPVIDTRQRDCGCRICGLCDRKLHLSGYTCDKCGTKLDTTKTFKDRAIENELKRSSFPCYHSKCPWVGSNESYRDHIASCKFADIRCPNSGCDVFITRPELQEHLKTCQYNIISCRWCKKNITPKTKKNHEMKDCPEYRIPCPNSTCDQKFPRRKLDEHLLKDCKKQKQKCKFFSYGCTFEGNLDQLHHHDVTDVSKHLEMVEKRVSTSNSDALMKLKKAESYDISSALELKVKESDRKVLGMHSELLALKEEMNRKLNPLNDGLIKMESALHDMQDSFQELALLVQTLQATSYNGTFIWKIPEVSRRRDEAISGKTISLYSAPFYTSRFGYKLCLRVYINGDGSGKGTHLSFFVTIMKGEYDALLSWPFNQMVTLMLLDQSNTKKHIVQCFKPEPTSSSFWRPQSDMNVASGCPKFAALSVLRDSNYVQDDTLFFKVVIDLAGLNQP